MGLAQIPSLVVYHVNLTLENTFFRPILINQSILLYSLLINDADFGRFERRGSPCDLCQGESALVPRRISTLEASHDFGFVENVGE